MIQLTDGIEAKNFITNELSKKLGNNNINSIINVDYCSLPEDDLKEYFKACYENVFFPYKNYPDIIYSYSFVGESNDYQIKKIKDEIHRHSNHNNSSLFITSLNKEELDSLNIEKRKENVSIININKYEVKKIPNKIEKLISLFIISFPLKYRIFKNSEIFISFFRNNQKYLIDLFINFLTVIAIFIVNLGSLALLIYLILLIFKAFALHIKGLLTLSTTCILLIFISLWTFNNSVLNLLPSLFITIISGFFLLYGLNSNFKETIIKMKDDSIWDPITYFKNKKIKGN